MKTSIFEYNSDDVRSGELEMSGEQERSTKKRAIPKFVYAIIIGVVSAALAVGVIFMIVDRVNEGLIMELQVGDIVPYAVEDGEYTGTYISNDMGAKVSVTIESGFVVDIALVSFEGIDTSRAQRVFNAVIAAQSLVTDDDEVGTEPTDIILLKAIGQAVNGETLN